MTGWDPGIPKIPFWHVENVGMVEGYTDCRRGAEWIESQREPSWFSKKVRCWYFLKSISMLCSFLWKWRARYCNQYVVKFPLYHSDFNASSVCQCHQGIHAWLYAPEHNFSRSHSVAFVETPCLVSFLV